MSAPRVLTGAALSGRELERYQVLERGAGDGFTVRAYLRPLRAPREAAVLVSRGGAAVDCLTCAPAAVADVFRHTAVYSARYRAELEARP